ncbi:MAG TPA: SDR family NAD(P)-dependent oxidoreductase [Pseudonocardiaceae bacterium]|nr:SDR family NAD(P)-dependent oxidoreductase [Pseudonocardiaceae bacterium]
MTELSGRVAVVTGSSRGIGKAIAAELAAAGAMVVLNSRSSAADGERAAAEIGGDYVQADVADYDGAQHLVTELVARHGRLDIVVNNADWFEPQPFEKDDPAYWDRIIGVGLRSAIHTIHAALPHLRRSDDPRVITIAGDSGRVGLKQGAVHAAAKAGQIALTKSLARELGEYGVRVNAISPGPIETEIWQGIQQSPDAEMLNRTQFESVFGVGQPSDVAYAVGFLASPRARHITGQTLSVNGGRAFPS